MKVQVYIYDLSMGLAAQLSPLFLGKQIEGVWHTGIVVFGKEYFFGGSGIEHCPPGGTLMGSPHKVHDLGETGVPIEIFQDYLLDLREKFNPQTYDLFTNNCNNFSNEVAQFLTGQSIPDNIVNLPSEVLETPFGQQLRPMLDRLQNPSASGTPLLQPGGTFTGPASVNPPSQLMPTPLPSSHSHTSSSATPSSGYRPVTSTAGTGSSHTVASGGSRTAAFPEANVRRIVNRGFTRSQAIGELGRCSGNTDAALASLFAKALKF